jgi:putative ABC transport system permease protein
VKILIAWRMLIHERWRSVLAVGGILVAILLMFLQIGLYSSVPRGGLRYYDVMTFDLMLTSSAYVSQAQSMTFPRRRLYQALAMPEIKRAIPVYQGSGRWLNPEEGLARDIFVIGYNPDDQVLNVPELYHDGELLRQTDVIFVDGSSRPEFGRLERGRRVEVEQRSEIIGGQYHLGIGFVGIGVAVVSDLNFERIFPGQGGLGNVSLGLLTLAPGADANAVATQLRQLLPADTQVFTRKELTDFEVNYWVNNTSTGIIFGFGVVVAVIVGIVILYQTLSAQIGRQLPQYATLKAMGYTNRQLGGIIVTIATIMSTAGYLPAVLISILIYWIIQKFTPLPIEMSAARMVAVLATTWGMSVMSAVLALRILRRADPADLF